MTSGHFDCGLKATRAPTVRQGESARIVYVAHQLVGRQAPRISSNESFRGLAAVRGIHPEREESTVASTAAC
jgi:hypothetical protein